MTSQVSREDVKDALFELGGAYKAREIQRTLVIIERYAVTVAERINKNNELLDVAPGNYHYLKPGETDINSGVRRCIGCGKVRNLSGFFLKDSRAPYKRRLRCIVCRPPNHWSDNRVRADRYLCQRCDTRKPLSKFPEEKRANPRLLMHCLECKA